MKKKPLFCPICGKSARQQLTWSKNRYGKKYRYKVFIHLEDGTKHYLSTNRGRKRRFREQELKTITVDDALKSVVSTMQFNQPVGFAELKKKAEAKRTKPFNNQTFTRAIVRGIVNSVLLKEGTGKDAVYFRRPIIEKKTDLPIRKIDITVSSTRESKVMQILIEVENPEGPSQINVLIQGTIGIDGEYKKEQLVFCSDKIGEIPGSHITNLLSYGDSNIISIELNDFIRKDEMNYIFLISKLSKNLDFFRLIMPSNTNEVFVRLLTRNFAKNQEESKRLKVLLLDGSTVDFPYVKVRGTKEQLVSISSVYRHLKKGEGIFIDLTMN